MKNIDVDIDDIIIRDNTSSMLDFKKEMKDKLPEEVIEDFVAKNNYKVYFVHNGIDIALEMESSGTQKYFALVVGALTGNAKYGEYIHIFDEIETHFHNELMKKFFNFFKTEIKGQLICTTHNQTILDEKLIGKENILFVDKKENSSEIYRLSSFDGIRSDKRHNWKKLYNEDRFGAYPNIKN
jgi:AAA15 family ATPase/GTPase